jgi:hypothetical protein
MSQKIHDSLLTAKEAANLLRLSTSWLAKARMRGDNSVARSGMPRALCSNG